MKTRLFVFVILVLAACGQAKWTQEELSTTVDTCVTAVVEGDNDPALFADAKQFCGCVYQEAANRWSYADYQANLTKYDQILENEVLEGCLNLAKTTIRANAIRAIRGVR